MINVLVVSEFNTIKELLRSALRTQSNVGNVILSRGGDLNTRGNQFGFDSFTGKPDIILYDLDSAKKEPQWKFERMLNDFQQVNNKVGGMASLVIVSSDNQLSSLQKEVSFIDAYVIKKPFTFKQVVQTVNNVWTSNLTC